MTKTHVAAVLFAWAVSATAQAAVLKADYQLQDSFASSIGTAIDLIPTDPLGQNGFTNDIVFGVARRVYIVDGNNAPSSDHAGLSFDATGEVGLANYSAEMVFKLAGDTPNTDYERLIDATGRTLDDGFYRGTNAVNEQIGFYLGGDVFGGASMPDLEYVSVVLTVQRTTRNAASEVRAYLNGSLSQFAVTDVLNINNAGNILNFFLDDLAGTESPDAVVACIRMYDGALTDDEVKSHTTGCIAGTDDLPTPAPLGLVLAGLLLMAGRGRRQT